MTARGRMVTQMALPAIRWQNTVPTTAPTAKKNSMPAWRAHFSRWDLSALLRWCSSLARPMPTWRMWLVTKVVATATPSAWRKVLYCMEARKFMMTCDICTGAESGMQPSISTAAISMNMSTVSQRTKKRCFIGLGSSSETNEPRI